jgi:LPS-assembly lipoprotein
VANRVHGAGRALGLGRAAAATVALALPAACGFHLRGATPLPAELRSVYLRAPDTALREPLARALQGAGVGLAPSPAEAGATLTVGPERLDRRLLSVDPRTARAREYELSYALPVQAVATNGTPILPLETVTLVRDFTYNPVAVLGKSEEEGLLYAEMRREAVHQVLRRLGAAARGLGASDAGQP